jgi:hypothetical protein
MKRLLFAMTALSALAAFPAAAQYSSQSSVNARGAMSFNSRIAQLETRIQAGIRSGAISRSEAVSLRRELRTLRRLERQYSVNGLTQQERADLQARLRDFRSDLRLADGRAGRDRYGWDDDDVDAPQSARVDRNNDGWDDRDYDRDGRWDDDVQNGSQSARVDRDNDGWDDRDYDRDGRWEDDVQGSQSARIDRNNDGWDDRDYDRDGQWEDDVYRGQGGPYEEANDACENRGVVGGLIDSVLGRQECSLRVGQRATGNLSAVPYEYRTRFRDGNGVYYRSDGRSIYQIDARTDTVVRIYSMNR